MKKPIAKLGILGLVTFILYIILVLSGSAVTPYYKFDQGEQALIFISLASFVIITALQLYRFYISNYSKEEGVVPTSKILYRSVCLKLIPQR